MSDFDTHPEAHAGLLADMAAALSLLEGCMRFDEDRVLWDEEAAPLLSRYADLQAGVLTPPEHGSAEATP